MMIGLLMAVALAQRSATPISLHEAEALVLRTPLVVRAVQERGARPTVELERTGPRGWLLRAYATNPCANLPKPCSSLIGYFEVDSHTAIVRDATPDEQPEVIGRRLLRLQERLRRRHGLPR